jgi:L-alanine-DL-glutamate epimerase-like enolase superfamily enzyme
MTRVDRVEAIPVSYPEPNDFGAVRHLCLVKIQTDDGVLGWGEAVTQFKEATLATRSIIEGMAERLIGRDPLRLPAIASSHASDADIGRIVEQAMQWTDTGLQGVKVGFGKKGHARFGFDHERDVEFVRRLRDGLGDQAVIMIDCGWNVRWDVTAGVRRAQAIDAYEVAWLEEPLGAWDPEGYSTLRSRTASRIAYGRRSGTSADTSGYSQLGPWTWAASIPDALKASPVQTGRGSRRILRAQANAHAWSSAICTAASLAISFSTPVCELFELKPLPNVMQHELVTKRSGHTDGWMEPPPGVGLGIEVVDEVVERFRSERIEAP